MKRLLISLVALGLLTLLGRVFEQIDFGVGIPVDSQSTQKQNGIVSLSGWNIQHLTGKLYIHPVKDSTYYQGLFQETQNISFWMYTFTYEDIQKFFVRIAKSGIKVSAILENKKYQEFGADYDKIRLMLVKAGIAVTNDEQMNVNYTHAKTFVLDQRYIIQTANLAYSSFTKNREFVFVGQQQDVRDNLQNLFERDVRGEKISSTDIHSNLLICPIDCRSKVEQLLSGAQKNILIHQQYISDDRILHILLEKKNIDLNILLADTKDNLVTQKKFGTNIVRLLKKPYLHSKVFLVDDKYLVVSSINFSKNSFDNNREIGIIITDQHLIAQFKKSFFDDFGK